MFAIPVLLALLGMGPALGPLQDPKPKSEKPAPADDLLGEGLDDLLGGEEPQAEDGGKKKVLTSWKGFVEVKPRIYFQDRGGEKPDEQLLFEAEWEFDFRFSDSLTGYFRPRVFVDALDSDLKRFEP